MTTMVFPWPDARLSPNRRKDLRALTAVRRAAHVEAWALVYESKLKLRAVPLQLRLTFWAPDNRRRDLDNLYSSFKAYQDGMFEALGLDDCLIRRVVLERGDVLKGGQVLVELIEIGTAS